MERELESLADKSPIVDDGGVWAWLLLHPDDFAELEKRDPLSKWIEELKHRGLKK